MHFSQFFLLNIVLLGIFDLYVWCVIKLSLSTSTSTSIATLTSNGKQISYLISSNLSSTYFIVSFFNLFYCILLQLILLYLTSIYFIVSYFNLFYCISSYLTLAVCVKNPRYDRSVGCNSKQPFTES